MTHMKLINVWRSDLFDMLQMTFRYTFRGTTYLPTRCLALFNMYVEHLMDSHKALLVEEVAGALAVCQSQGKTLGNAYEHTLWEKFVEDHRSKV